MATEYQIFRVSHFTGKTNSMMFPISQEEILARRKSPELIQDQFPELSVDQREFLMNGVTPEEWTEVFGEEEEEQRNYLLAATKGLLS